MDFFELIEDRRSVRRFEDHPVEEALIAKILRTALRAPSSKNTRSTSFMVVDSPEMLQRISEMRDFGSAFVKDAPLAIVVMGDETLTDLWVDNASISATYLQLAAQALGLGSCWVHINGRPRRKDDPAAGDAAGYLRTFLPIPQGRNPLCLIALGHPAATTHSPKPEPDIAARVIKINTPQ